MDKTLKRICEEVAKEEGLPAETVEFAVRHLCDWTRQSLINMDYTAVLWNKLGTFKILKRRAKGYEDIVEEFKNNFKK
jgi:hypothetical protein